MHGHPGQQTPVLSSHRLDGPTGLGPIALELAGKGSWELDVTFTPEPSSHWDRGDTGKGQQWRGGTNGSCWNIPRFVRALQFL